MFTPFTSIRPSIAHGAGSFNVIRVRWRSRTTGFESTTVEAIIEKACTHFRLGSSGESYMLVGSMDGSDLELSDDLLKRLADGSVVTLTKIPAEYDSDGDTGCSRFSESSETLQAGSHSWLTVTQQPPRPPVYTGEECSLCELDLIEVFVRTMTGMTFGVKIHSSYTVCALKTAIEARDGIPSCQQRLIFATQHLQDHATLESCGIRKESTIHLTLRLRGGKPVIYILPPQPVAQATVSVHLVPQWHFSHTYPLVHPKELQDSRQSVTWSVSAQPDGSLVETDTGLELSYLFWEALSNPGAPPSPPLDAIDAPRARTCTGPHAHVEHFDPASPDLDPSSPTAVMLSFADLLPYLDRVLKSLTLHTAARNDFITYWLPALSKKPFVALRFLPQAAYERAAELEVEPKPDVVTRVFMLFRGVTEEETEMWAVARERVTHIDWVGHVGVRPDALDASRFRVLEWGGMEVL